MILSASHLGFLCAFFFAGVLLFGRRGIDLDSSLTGDSAGCVGVTLRRSRTGVNGDSSSESDDSVEDDGISALMDSGSVFGAGRGVGSSSSVGDILCGLMMRGMSCWNEGAMMPFGRVSLAQGASG